MDIIFIRDSNWNVHFKSNRKSHRQKHKKMSGTVILLIVIVATYYLGKYALLEGQKIERQKKFKKK